MNELTKLIKADMLPALGVTEPGSDRIQCSEGTFLHKRRIKTCKCCNEQWNV